MSYDLAVFDPEIAPRGRDEFIDWYKNQTGWVHDGRHNEPSTAGPRLQAWFFEVIETIPPMNGPHKRRVPEGEPDADYSINAGLIYFALYGPKTVGYDIAVRAAERHRIGFFHVSYPTEAWWPDGTGKLVMVHRYSP